MISSAQAENQQSFVTNRFLVYTYNSNSTSVSQRFSVDSDGYITNSIGSMSSGLVTAQQVYVLGSVYGGANIATAQSLLGTAVSVAANMTYAFDTAFVLSCNLAANTHVVSFALGGSAGIAQLQINGTSANGNGLVSSGSYTGNVVSACGNVNVVALTGNVIGGGNCFVSGSLRGMVSVASAGNLTPQYQLSDSIGTYSTQAGSYFMLTPIASSTGNIAIGGWTSA
jgi:hypothetical protein